MSASADFSRTCEGCSHLASEPWTKGKKWFRCFAPGPNKGYHVGTGRVLPYVPAWCPEQKRTAPDGANIEDGRPEGQT